MVGIKRKIALAIFVGLVVPTAAIAHHGPMNDREREAAELAERNYGMQNAHCQEIIISGRTMMGCVDMGFKTPRTVPDN